MQWALISTYASAFKLISKDWRFKLDRGFKLDQEKTPHNLESWEHLKFTPIEDTNLRKKIEDLYTVLPSYLKIKPWDNLKLMILMECFSY